MPLLEISKRQERDKTAVRYGGWRNIVYQFITAYINKPKMAYSRDAFPKDYTETSKGLERDKQEMELWLMA